MRPSSARHAPVDTPPRGRVALPQPASEIGCSGNASAQARAMRAARRDPSCGSRVPRSRCGRSARIASRSGRPDPNRSSLALRGVILRAAHGREARLTFSRYFCSMLSHAPFTLRSENACPSMLGQLPRRTVCAGANGVPGTCWILLLRCRSVRSENILSPSG
jgi:hypothetical protein